jgi:hypothetical protein
MAHLRTIRKTERVKIRNLTVLDVKSLRDIIENSQIRWFKT